MTTCPDYDIDLLVLIFSPIINDTTPSPPLYGGGPGSYIEHILRRIQDTRCNRIRPSSQPQITRKQAWPPPPMPAAGTDRPTDITDLPIGVLSDILHSVASHINDTDTTFNDFFSTCKQLYDLKEEIVRDTIAKIDEKELMMGWITSIINRMKQIIHIENFPTICLSLHEVNAIANYF